MFRKVLRSAYSSHQVSKMYHFNFPNSFLAFPKKNWCSREESHLMSYGVQWKANRVLITGWAETLTQPAFTCSELTIATLEKGGICLFVKYKHISTFFVNFKHVIAGWVFKKKHYMALSETPVQAISLQLYYKKLIAGIFNGIFGNN